MKKYDYVNLVSVLKGLKILIKKHNKKNENSWDNFKLKYNGRKVELDIDYGLCSNISTSLIKSGVYDNNEIEKLEIKVKKYFKTWENFSGDKRFPIIPKLGYSRGVCSFYSDDQYPKYLGYSRKQRLSLINHIVKQIKKDYFKKYGVKLDV